MRLLLFIGMILPPFVQELYAQIGNNYLHYTIRDGLPSNEVYDLHQDANGIIWMATDLGIAKYDGYGFEYITKKDGITDHTILKFILTPDSGMLCVTRNSKLFYIHKKGNIEVFSGNTDLQKIAKASYIKDLIFITDRSFYFTGTGELEGLWKYDAVSEHFSLLLHTGFPAPLHGYAWKQGGKYMTGLMGGKTVNEIVVPSLHPVKNTVDIKWFYFPQFSSFSTHGAAGFNEKTVLYYDNRLLIFDEQDQLEKNITLPGIIMNMVEIAPDLLCVLTRKGFYLLDDTFGLSDVHIPLHVFTDALTDREGNIWLSTLDDGVYVYSRWHIPTIAGLEPGTVISQFLPLEEDVLALRTQDGSYFTIQVQKDPTQSFFWIKIPEPHVFKTVVLPGQRKFLLADAHEGIGLAWMDFMEQPLTLFPGNLRRITETSEQAFLFHTSSRYFMTDLQGKMQTRFYEYPEDETKRVVFFHQGTYYLGTHKGLYYYTPEIDSGAYMPHPGLEEQIQDITLFMDRYLAVLTKSNGVFLFTDSLIQLDVSDKFHSILYKSMVCDANNIFVASNRGLIKFSMDTAFSSQSNEIISRFEGLASDNVLEIFSYGSYLFLATDENAYVIPKEVSFSSISFPTLYFRSVFVGDTAIDITTKHIFENRENDFNFLFSSVYFGGHAKIKYHYFLEGFDHDWNITKKRQVKYLDLPHGKYTFHLMAESAEGILSPEITYDFTIKPRFIQTAGFTYVCGLTGSLVIGVGILWMLYSRKKRRSNQQKILLAEIKSLKAQMNPHFIFNALSSIQRFLWTHNPGEANHFLASFAALMRNILEYSGKFSISIHEEIKMLHSYCELENLRLDNKLRFHIDIDHTLDAHSISIPPMLIQPFIENAIWHGLNPKGGGNIDLVIKKVKNRLHIHIRDNGIGRAAATLLRKKRHISTGMANMKNRIQLMNAMGGLKIDLAVEDLREGGNPSGTLVKLMIWFRNH